MRLVFGPSQAGRVIAGQVVVSLIEIRRTLGVENVSVKVPAHAGDGPQLLKVYAVYGHDAPTAEDTPESYLNAAPYNAAVDAGDPATDQVLIVPVADVKPAQWFVQTILAFDA